MKKILIYVLPLVLMLSCGSKAESEGDTTAGADLIEITSEQFKISEMELGEPTMQSFSDEIACKGFVVAPADGVAKVSSPISGTVESIRVKIGDFVRQGQVICNISGSEFLELQQQFAEAAATYQKAKLDYERTKALRAEKIGSEKEFTASESIYHASLASYNALKARVRALKINPSRIESGEMQTSFPVAAPISGYITRTDAVIGQYVDVQNELAEVVNVNSLQLQLSVFETNLRRLKVGQKVRFNVCGSWSQSAEATLITVGKAINPETRAIDCIARIDNADRSKLVNQSYAEAKIIVDNIEAKALPVDASQKEEDNYFVFLLEKQESDKYFLRRIEVEVGKVGDDYIEILSDLPAGKQVLVNGVATL